MRRSISLLLVVAVLLGLVPAVMAQDSGTPTASAGMTMIATGLTNPRGFAWADDGTLYLAEAGNGGDTRIPVIEGFTVRLGLSSSIVKIANGCIAPVEQGLVSALWEEPDWVWGTMDVAFLNGDLYALISGGGPSWLTPSSRSGVYKINDDGTMTLVADITTWLPQHLPKNVPPDYGSDGSLFDLEATSDALVLSEAVGGQIIKVTPAGEMSVLADLSAEHPVPSGLAVGADGSVYVGYENAVPFPDGAAKVSKIAPDGTVSDVWTNLTRIADLAIGPDGTLYAEEMSTGNTDTEPYAQPNTGRIVRQTGPDTAEVVAEGLNFPVGMNFGPDGALYVSGPANGANNGEGWLARLDMGGAAASPVAAVASEPCAPTAAVAGTPSVPLTGTAGATPAASADAAAKIADAMSAGPASIANGATILDYAMDANGKFVVLRQGSNGWTCFPDTPGGPVDDPTCFDQTWMEFVYASMANEKPNTTVPGIAYMLQGGSDASNTDPFATEPAAGEDWVISSPHIMIILPEGLDQTVFSTDPNSGGPWIMYAGTPYEHIMMPVGAGGAMPATTPTP
jgi:sugar lactone lactonase YvrE